MAGRRDEASGSTGPALGDDLPHGVRGIFSTAGAHTAMGWLVAVFFLVIVGVFVWAVVSLRPVPAAKPEAPEVWVCSKTPGKCEKVRSRTGGFSNEVECNQYCWGAKRYKCERDAEGFPTGNCVIAAPGDSAPFANLAACLASPTCAPSANVTLQCVQGRGCIPTDGTCPGPTFQSQGKGSKGYEECQAVCVRRFRCTTPTSGTCSAGVITFDKDKYPIEGKCVDGVDCKAPAPSEGWVWNANTATCVLAPQGFNRSVEPGEHLQGGHADGAESVMSHRSGTGEDSEIEQVEEAARSLRSEGGLLWWSPLSTASATPEMTNRPYRQGADAFGIGSYGGHSADAGLGSGIGGAGSSVLGAWTDPHELLPQETSRAGLLAGDGTAATRLIKDRSRSIIAKGEHSDGAASSASCPAKGRVFDSYDACMANSCPCLPDQPYYCASARACAANAAVCCDGTVCHACHTCDTSTSTPHCRSTCVTDPGKASDSCYNCMTEGSLAGQCACLPPSQVCVDCICDVVDATGNTVSRFCTQLEPTDTIKSCTNRPVAKSLYKLCKAQNKYPIVRCCDPDAPPDPGITMRDCRCSRTWDPPGYTCQTCS